MTQIWISLFFFIFAQIITFTPAFAAGELISGKIVEIQPSGGNQYQITLESGDERPTFMIDEKTLIQRFIQAKNIKKGQKIMSGDEEQGVIKGIKGMKGVKGMKSPFGGMSAGALKNLGLPNIPNVPSVPEIPSVPDIPKMPKKSELPQQIPGVGMGGAPAAGGAPPAEGAPGPESGGKGEQARKPQDVPPPIPDDAGGSLS
ncbi:MAG: hypothetical protein PHN49_12555, partial [Candidatus Omnitrophica bacterium]|nr:hypothetical protein [Candidatus Omnitrophota bacterium]